MRFGVNFSYKVHCFHLKVAIYQIKFKVLFKTIIYLYARNAMGVVCNKNLWIKIFVKRMFFMFLENL